MVRDDLSQFQGPFLEEAREHVRTLEARLLELESRPGDSELLNALFRAVHSVKGSSGMLGFEVISHLSHSMENVLDPMREGRLTVDGPTTSLLLEANDLLGSCVQAATDRRDPPDIKQVVARLDAVKPGSTPAATVAGPAAQAAAPREEVGPRTYTIVFRPKPEVFSLGLQPAGALDELRGLGKARVDLLVDRVPSLEELDPERCHLGWRIELETEASETEVREVFMFFEDVAELEVGSTEPAFGVFTPLLSAPAPSAPGPVPATATTDAAKAEAATLRVTTEKVDRLMNLVGELVISQAMISRSLQDLTPAELPRLREAVSEMERHTRELQDRVMNIRMVPIGTIFGRFRRQVRDLAASLGKEIVLETVGDEVEIDKSMIEHLADPITHLVRNSADHGLEPTADRVAAGKPAAGRITLSARHQGGNVVVEIADDGRGLNTERIRAKAVERSLVGADAALSDDQVHELIFLPGFSTASEVTDVSGRGVGMDVVKRHIEQLNGTITLASVEGRGMRVRLSLPLTLAILDGMAVRVGQSMFVLPLNQVTETLALTRTGVLSLVNGAEVVLVRGQTMPLLRLAKLLDVADDGPANPRPLAVVLEAGELRFALMIDELLSKAQFVLKSLEPNHSKVDGVLGATILGDGAVSYILDVQGLGRLGNVRLKAGADRLAAPTRPSEEVTV